jgi:methionyl-tRNA formyltransferase
LQHEIDTGNILLQKSLDIGPNETAGELHDRMKVLGAEVVLASVRGLESKTLKGIPQQQERVSYAPKLTHEICRIDFSKPVDAVHNFIRGLSPHPTAWTMIDGAQLNVFRSTIVSKAKSSDPGTIDIDNGCMDVACLDGWVRLLEIQMQGKKKMSTRDFLNGYKVRIRTVGSSS